MTFTPGLDVSEFQKVINWPQVYGAGYRFAIIKASEGMHTFDAQFETNYNGAKAAGLVVGVYHFVHPEVAAADQLAHFLQVLGDRTPDLPIALDHEFASNDPAAVTSVITDLVTGITQHTGRKPMIYTRASYWDPLVHGGLNWPDYDLWIANYGASTPALPKAWQSWRFWQYSETGQINGVPSDKVDLDWFNGTVDELKIYVQQSGGPAMTSAPPGEFPKTMYIIAAAGLNLRQQPNTSATILQKIPRGTKIQVEAGSAGLYVQISAPAAGWIAKGDGAGVDYISSSAPQP